MLLNNISTLTVHLNFNVIRLTCDRAFNSSVKYHVTFEFRIHKSDMMTKKDRYGLARQLNNKYCHSPNLFVYLPVQLIEKVYFFYDDCNIEDYFIGERKMLAVLVIYKYKRYEYYF